MSARLILALAILIAPTALHADDTSPSEIGMTINKLRKCLSLNALACLQAALESEPIGDDQAKMLELKEEADRCKQALSTVINLHETHWIDVLKERKSLEESQRKYEEGFRKRSDAENKVLEKALLTRHGAWKKRYDATRELMTSLDFCVLVIEKTDKVAADTWRKRIEKQREDFRKLK